MCRRYYRSTYKPDSSGLFGLSEIETAPLFSDSKCDISPATFQPIIRRTNRSRKSRNSHDALGNDSSFCQIRCLI